MKWIAARLQMGTWTYVSNLLNEPAETQPNEQEVLPTTKNRSAMPARMWPAWRLWSGQPGRAHTTEANRVGLSHRPLQLWKSTPSTLVQYIHRNLTR